MEIDPKIKMLSDVIFLIFEIGFPGRTCLTFSPIFPSLITDKINLFLVFVYIVGICLHFLLTDWQLLSVGCEIKMQPKVMGQGPKI